MKKQFLLNSNLSSVISRMGHTDTLAIGDCGLPIPEGVERIDLALYKGVPTLLQTIDAVLSELCVQEVIMASEIKEASPELYGELLRRFEGVPVSYVPHEEFKRRTAQTKAVVRTGECRSYANVILISGVTF